MIESEKCQRLVEKHLDPFICSFGLSIEQRTEIYDAMRAGLRDMADWQRGQDIGLVKDLEVSGRNEKTINHMVALAIQAIKEQYSPGEQESVPALCSCSEDNRSGKHICPTCQKFIRDVNKTKKELVQQTKDFRWNELKETKEFWDTKTCQMTPNSGIRSDKSLVTDNGGISFQEGLEALCRVVSELIEIEENRNK